VTEAVNQTPTTIGAFRPSWLLNSYAEERKTTLLAFMLMLAPLGCAPNQFTTVTLYDNPGAFVRLETDATVEPGQGHSHPVTITPDQVAAVLHGVMIEEPITRLPFYDDISQPHRHRVFDDQTIELFAPLLALGLSKATPEEVVTFYRSKRISGTRREVTSGGLFVQGDALHIVLSNYRSPTNYMADIGVADTTDDRLTPMRALAPQRGRLDFEPPTALQAPASHGWWTFLQQDKRELVVFFQKLPPLPLSTLHSPDTTP
jgi:hypothetical protein